MSAIYGSLFAYLSRGDTTPPEDQEMKDTEIRANKLLPIQSDERSISAPADTKAPPPPEVKREEATDLYESLQSKRELFKILELQGYLNKSEAAPIKEEIDRALADLEEITQTRPQLWRYFELLGKLLVEFEDRADSLAHGAQFLSVVAVAGGHAGVHVVQDRLHEPVAVEDLAEPIIVHGVSEACLLYTYPSPRDS